MKTNEMPISKTGRGSPNLNMHFKHNSLVDFSFIKNEKQSTNALTLIHLNALFEMIADRDAMVIRADKLFRLILKTDLNKFKVEWYKQKLGIDEITSKKAKGHKDTEARMISRGPFIATFKHESITFVNSLETAARPLSSHRRKKRKKKSAQGNISGELHSFKFSVKTEPNKKNKSLNIECSHTEKNGDEEEMQSNSPKRKKIEDKTGMIIVAEIDHDEISAVSVSPTSTIHTTTSENSCVTPSKPAQTLQKIDGLSLNVSQSKKKARKDRTKSTRQNSKSRRKKRLRSIRSVGDSPSSRSEHSCNSSCSRSVVSNETASTKTNPSLTSHDHSKAHQRSPSDENTRVDIREILEENSQLNDLFMSHRTSGQDPYFYKGHHALPMEIHNHDRNLASHMIYAYPPSHYNSLQQQHSYPYTYQYHSDVDNIEYEECFLIKGVAAFFKKVFGLDKKQEILEPSSQRFFPNIQYAQQMQPNIIASRPPVLDWQRPSRVFDDNDEQLKPAITAPHPPVLDWQRPVPIPRRSRSVSRVFDDNDEQLKPAITAPHPPVLDWQRPAPMPQRSRSVSRVFDDNDEQLKPAINAPHPPVLDWQRPAPMPQRSRSVSRVFDDNHNDEYFQHVENVARDNSDIASLKTESSRKITDTGRRTLSFGIEENPEKVNYSRSRTQSFDGRVEKAMSEWKAAGPGAYGPSLSITQDFTPDNKMKLTQRKNSSSNFNGDHSSVKSSQRKLKQKNILTPVDSKEVVRKKKTKITNKNNIGRTSVHCNLTEEKNKKRSNRSRPKSIASLSRSKTDTMSAGLSKKRTEKPSLIKSSSLGSTSSISQNRTGGRFHYR